MTAVEATSRPSVAGQRGLVVVTAVVTAVAGNVLVYSLGRFAGGEFSFIRNGSTVEVDATTVAGFSAVPLGLGLTLVALLARRLPWTARVALFVAPALAVATVGVMTVPVDLDAVSTLTLATCHLTLVPISITALRRLRL